MHKVIPAALVCLLVAAPAFGENQKNLVLKRPYTYFPKPMYHDCKDEGDVQQLTDGVTQYAANMWVNKSCVGWAQGVNVPIVMHFDLGAEATLSELRFNTAGGGGAGVVEVGLRIFLSLDDKSYVPAAEHKAPPLPTHGKDVREGVRIKVLLGDARARYVAVVAMAPAPHYYVFVDEIQIIGGRPADPKSQLPVQSALTASGAQQLQELVASVKRAGDLMTYLTAPVERHVKSWPAKHAEAQLKDLDADRKRAIAQSNKYDQIRADFTASHRDRARQVYGKDTLLWETVPDDNFTMLSLPNTLSPPQRASVHTAINALEATALGVANLTDSTQPLRVTVSGTHAGGPTVTPRVARFFETTNARYVPDILLLTDSPHVIPAGESRLVWIGVESTGAKPGAYGYQVNIQIGAVAHRIPLVVHVHNVTLSRNTPLWTGNWSDLNTGEHPLFPLVRKSMLEHRITIGAGSVWPRPKKDAQGKIILPIEMDTTDLDKFIAFHKDFPQLTIFVGFHPHADRPHYDWFGPAPWMSDPFKEVFRVWLSTIIERFKAGGRDYDQFAIMMFDETLDPKVVQICELAHEVDPNLRTMITHSQASRGATRQMVAAGMDIFAHHAVRVEYDNAPDGYEILSSNGRELWFYGAADAAYGGGKERDSLGFYRYMHWTAFLHGATGVHFWNMLHNNGRSPTWAPETVGQNYWPLVYPIGPGYPEPPDDVRTAEQVIPSRRWEYVRMGIEDYMLLQMARESIDELGDAGAVQKRTLNEIIRTVVKNRDADRALFRAKRRELLELIEMLTATCQSAAGNRITRDLAASPRVPGD